MVTLLPHFAALMPSAVPEAADAGAAVDVDAPAFPVVDDDDDDEDDDEDEPGAALDVDVAVEPAEPDVSAWSFEQAPASRTARTMPAAGRERRWVLMGGTFADRT
jgi:hypothetical protein